jgi:hypothetical protein
VAFPGLLGRQAPLPDDDMRAFTDFILQVAYPPNPVRNLDDSLTADQQAGREVFFASRPDGRELPSDTFRNCNGCHVLDRQGNAQHGVASPGFFGSEGAYSFEAESQFFKVPHLRNMYQKVGMFGMARTFSPGDRPGFGLPFLPPPYNDESFQGDQVRGFGFLHDGTVDTLFRFHGTTVFARTANNPGGFPIITDPGDPVKAQQELEANLRVRRQIEAFMLVFDSNLAPIVGQQATLTGGSGADVHARLDLLQARAAAGDCDLVASGLLLGHRVGFLYDPGANAFRPAVARLPPVKAAHLRWLARTGVLTYMAVPPGSGHRIGIDRDSDGLLDGDED